MCFMHADLDSSDGTVNTSELSRSIAEHVIGTPAYNHSNLAFQSDKYAVVPEFTITHSGLLTRWLFAAQLPTTLSLAQEKPQLQVWRRAPNRFRDTFRLVHTTNCSLQQYKKGNSLGTHEYLLEEPARVEAGDILGFYQPANNESRLNLALLRNTETLMNELVLLHTEPFLLAMSNSNGNERILPLMSAEILPGELKYLYSLFVAMFPWRTSQHEKVWASMLCLLVRKHESLFTT